jgi:hypothetical protein
MGIFGLGSRASQPNRLGSVQVGTSEYGVAEPIGWGSFKAPIKLLDYTDFSSVAQKAGGKGGGGVSSYEYYASIDALLVRGPIGGIGNVYDSGGASQLLASTEAYTIGGGGGHQVSHGGSVFYNDEGVTHSVTYSTVANDFGSDGSVTLSGSQPAPFERVAAAPGHLQYTVSTGGNYQFSTTDNGITVTITHTYTNADTTDNVNGPGSAGFDARSPALRYNLAYALGTTPQAPWSYMLGAHPERALGYTGLARVLGRSMSLGTSATVPNLAIEILNGRLKAFGNGVADCDPSAIITDLLESSDAGCSWPYLGDLTIYSNFCVAHNLFMSLFVDNVRKVSEIIGEICDLSNAAPVWSGPSLKIVPYGDTTAVGNGRTYTPPTEPIYLIDEAEMICAAGEEPVEIGDPNLSDNYNRVQVEYSNRGDNYNTALIHEQDEASILTNGLLPMQTVTAHHYCEKLYASILMGMLLRRKATPLRTFDFTLPWYYQLLEPMDILEINITLGSLGITPIRIVSVEEQEDYSLKVTAEDFLFGVAAGIVYPKGASSGNGTGAYDLPGNTTPVILDAPLDLQIYSGSELWIGAAGANAAWGGCNVLASTDGSTYSLIGTIATVARVGTLSAAYPSGALIDTTDPLHISLVSTSATLASGTVQDADNANTLSFVDGELIAYSAAALTGPGQYTLGTYTRRALMGTASAAHAAGSNFLRLDSAVFKYPYKSSWVGKTIYLKFQSFNAYGNCAQDLSTLAAYTFVPAGTNYPAPPIVTVSQTTSTTNSGGLVTSGAGVAAVYKISITVTWTWPTNFPTPSGYNVVLYEGTDPTNTTTYIAPVAIVGATSRSFTFSVSPNSTLMNVNAAVEAVYA